MHSLWREYAGYFRPHLKTLAGITVAGLVQSFAYVPLAALLRWIFDDILVSRRRGDLWIAIAALLECNWAGWSWRTGFVSRRCA